MRLKYIFLGLMAFLITGCETMKLEDFKGETPTFVLEDYFLGKTRGYGLFENRGGKVTTQFVVDIIGKWEGDEFLLEEDFTYSDGRKEFFTWRIRKTGPGQYEGRREGVVGVAIGRSDGNALNWSYKMDLPRGDGSIRLSFDDWMILQQDDILMNRAQVSKFGFHVGSVTLSFRKLDD